MARQVQRGGSAWGSTHTGGHAVGETRFGTFPMRAGDEVGVRADTDGGLLHAIVCKTFRDPTSFENKVFYGLVKSFNHLSEHYWVVYDDGDSEDMPAPDVRQYMTNTCLHTKEEILAKIGLWVSTHSVYVPTKEIHLPADFFLLDIKETPTMAGSKGIFKWTGRGFKPIFVSIHDNNDITYRHEGQLTKDDAEQKQVKQHAEEATGCMEPKLYVRPSHKRKWDAHVEDETADPGDTDTAGTDSSDSET